MSKPRKYVKTTTLLAEELDITRQALNKYWEPKPGYPTKTSKGWDVQAVAEFIADYKANKEQVTGENQDAKRKKLDLECQLLQVKLDRLKGELVSLEDLASEVTEMAGIVNAGLEEFVQWVTVTYRKADTTAKAKDLRDRTKRWLASKMEESE